MWAILHEHGLERYYDLRALGGGDGGPARITGRTYAELDDPGFRARACRPDAAGGLATDLFLEGVHCRACVWLVEKLPRVAPGVLEARLDLARSRVRVRWDPAVTVLSAVARRLDALGYRPHPVRGLAQQEVRRREDRRMLARIGLAGAVAGNVMAIAFALYGGMLHGMEREYATLFRWTSLVLTVPSLVWGGGVFFRGAWAALSMGALHMDLPISLGLVAGFLHGVVATVRGTGEVYFDSVTALVFLLLVGRHVQRRQQRAAADAAELLASLAPSVARRLDADGGVREVPLEALVAGDRVEVRTGELIPADGAVVEGHSSVDVALLSGESRPVTVGPGDRVHAGTVNLARRLEVSVELTGEDTRVGRLMRLVDEHRRRRAPVVELADRISGVFVAVVIGLAVLTVALWWRHDPSRALDHAVALLIVTCPCALGLATPLAVSAAIGQAARAGFVIRGADVFERLTRPGRLWLDKTGTLTEGRMTLVHWAGDAGARPLVAAVEGHSAHPVARALVEGLAPGPGEPGARRPPVAPGTPGPGGPGDAVPGQGSADRGHEVTETPGRGVEGVVAGRRVVVGSPPFVGRRAGPVDGVLATAVDTMTDDGLTPVLVAVDGVVVAVAGLGDALRPDARDAVAHLRHRGWRLGILSGDHPAVVEAVRRQLDVDRGAAHGGMSPEDKLRIVGEAGDLPVIMVGDGVNDAAALAAATVGVAVHGGAEAALEAADVYVTRPGVNRIVDLLDAAPRVMAVIRRNLVFSLLYNVAGAALAMAGLLNPLVAAILMPASSLTVITSSYRARTFRAPGHSGRAPVASAPPGPDRASTFDGPAGSGRAGTFGASSSSPADAER